MAIPSSWLPYDGFINPHPLGDGPAHLEAGLRSLTCTSWSFLDVPLLLAGDGWNVQSIAVLAILACPIMWFKQ